MLYQIFFAVIIAIPLGILTVVIWLGLCILLNRVKRTNSEKLALAQFRKDYPDLTPGFTGKTEDGPLDVVMIAYGSTRPPRRMYYAVERGTDIAKRIEDD